MKQGLTEVIMVLDKSGSMDSIRQSTIEGVNSFIESQRRAPGQCRLTIIQFDDHYEVTCNGLNIQAVKPLGQGDFVPRGWTALYGATGRAIDEAGQRFSKLPDSEMPEHVVLVIVTDGQENSSPKYEWSKMWTLERVRQLIEQQKNQWGWKVVYIGAENALENARSLGVDLDHALRYSANIIGTQAMYAAVASNTTLLRSGGSKRMAFSADQHKAQQDAVKK